jgi:hypothetical protein
MGDGEAAETTALKGEVFRYCSVAAAITLEPDPAAANSHNLEAITLYAIRTANRIGIRHLENVKKLTHWSTSRVRAGRSFLLSSDREV